MNAYTSTFHVSPTGARVELAAFAHAGREFTAMGSIVDHEAGHVMGYPTAREVGHVLRTWSGEDIAPIRLVRSWKQRTFYGTTTTIYAWRATIDGRTYHGRNSGAGMLLRLRRGSP
jgi:hypothetical protein